MYCATVVDFPIPREPTIMDNLCSKFLVLIKYLLFNMSDVDLFVCE